MRFFSLSLNQLQLVAALDLTDPLTFRSRRARDADHELLNHVYRISVNGRSPEHQRQ
jgi:hypothetical protein